MNYPTSGYRDFSDSPGREEGCFYGNAQYVGSFLLDSGNMTEDITDNVGSIIY